jgi:predicted nuclease with TOPRIM domain
MKKKILIILAAIVVPFLALLVLFFFLYPYLNEEKHKQVVSEMNMESIIESAQNGFTNDEIVYDVPAPEENNAREYTTEDYDELPNNLELLVAEQNYLQNVIDSLKSEKELLVKKLDELNSSVDSVNAMGSSAINEAKPLLAEAIDELREEFSDRVKSFLNLEEEELSPIVRQLSDEQLIRLYNSAGNIQREKLLRSLSADRAAKLMERIMS